MNWKAKYEKEHRRANTLASHVHQAKRDALHAQTLAAELHHSMERDTMGIHLPPYCKLAIVAVHQATGQAYMNSICMTDPGDKA